MPHSVLDQDITFSELRFGVRGDNPHQVIRNIAWTIGRQLSIAPSDVQDIMSHRHREDMVGFGGGVAIFDWVSPAVDTPYVMLAKLDKLVDFNATDDLRIDIVLSVISPEHIGSLHLQYLSKVTRMFREHRFLDRIRSVQSADGLSSILTDRDNDYGFAVAA